MSAGKSANGSPSASVSKLTRYQPRRFEQLGCIERDDGESMHDTRQGLH
jgi:hypothetical protein